VLILRKGAPPPEKVDSNAVRAEEKIQISEAASSSDSRTNYGSITSS
jgi:hypothetical protein